MPSLVVVALLILFFTHTSKVFADDAEWLSNYMGGDSGGESYVPEEDTQSPSQAAFENYGAEGAADTGNYVGVMLDDARENDQMIQTGTGYDAFTQSGYVYRVDADGRGFQQLGENLKTGALIDPNTGKVVDYNTNSPGYDTDGTGAGTGGAGGGYVATTSSGEQIELAPGNDYRKLEDGTYGWKATDGKYYWYDEETGTMNPVDMSGVSGTGGAQGGSGLSGDLVDATGNKVQYDADGLAYFTDSDGNKQYYNTEKSSFYDSQTGAEYKMVAGKPYMVGYDENKNPYYTDEKGDKFTVDGNGNLQYSGTSVGSVSNQVPGGTIERDPATGKIITFSDGKQSYSVGYNQAGVPFYTNGAGQQVLLGQSASGVVYGVPAASMGGGNLLSSAAGWASNLLGLSGGIGYNKNMGGLYGGLGFNSSSGYGASSSGGTIMGGGGGILSSLFGTSGTGTTTSGGFGYTPGQGWSGGMGFSSGTGTVGYSGAGGYGGGYASPMGYFGMGGGWNPGNYLSTGLPAGSIYNIIQSVTLWILAIFGFICIIGFIISGIMYLTAAGDDEQQKKAKKALYYSITGVIVGLVGLVIIFAVNALLHGASYF